MNKYLDKKTVGKFQVNGVNFLGELDINGEDTSLNIWSDQLYSTTNLTQKYIHGTLSDLQLVTLMNIVDFGSGNHAKRRQDGSYEQSYFKKFFPHYILFGNSHLDITTNCFEAIEFIPSDSTTLFFTSKYFHEIIHSNKELAEQLIRDDLEKTKQIFGYDNNKKYEYGDNPIISLFTGSYEILSFDTSIGRVEIKNNISKKNGKR